MNCVILYRIGGKLEIIHDDEDGDIREFSHSDAAVDFAELTQQFYGYSDYQIVELDEL